MRGMVFCLAALSLIVVAINAQAESLKAYILSGKVSGNIRSYYFNQINDGSSADNKYAYALGGMIKVQTAPFYGVTEAIAFYTANGLGANDLNPPYAHLDSLLLGTRNSLNVLGQAYVQYQNVWIRVRAGNQLLHTPWTNPSDAFMIPSTFQAVSVVAQPVSGLQLIGIRAFRFKNRTQENYQQETLLNQNFLYADVPEGNSGALVFGAKQNWHALTTEAWFYQFNSLADMFYGTVHYAAPKIDSIQPFASFQYAREWGSGPELAGPVNATILGGMVGINNHYGQLFAAYDVLPARQSFSEGGNVLHNGGFISPYTQQYSADPLYTSIMDYGLVSASAAGHAWKFGIVLHPMRTLRIKYSYSMYETAPYIPTVDANYLDVTYTPGHFLKGLSIRDRVAVDHNDPFAGYHGTFIDDRLMLQYTF